MRIVMQGLLTGHGAELAEALPLSIRARHRLPPIGEAIQQVHFPPPQTDLVALEREAWGLGTAEPPKGDASMLSDDELDAELHVRLGAARAAWGRTAR